MSQFKFPIVFDRDLKILTLSMSTRRLSMGSLEVVRAIYFSLLGLSPVEIGILLSIGTFVSALRHISFGVLSDRYGRKIFLVLGAIFATLRMVIYAVSRDFWLLALAQGIGAMGEGAGAGQPVVSGFIADKIEPTDRPKVFSTLSITNAIAATFGSLMAGLPAIFQVSMKVDVLTAHNYLFWIGALGAGISVILSILLSENVVLEAKESQLNLVEHVTPKRPWDVIFKFSLIRSTSGLGMGLIYSLMPLYFFQRFGVGGEYLGPVYALSRFLSIFSYLLVPRVVEKLGNVQTLVISRVSSAIGAIVFTFSSHLSLCVGLLVFMRILNMFSMPIRQTLATSIVKQDEIATTIGISNFARMGIRTIAPTTAGYMFEVVSYTMPFLTGAIFLVINAVMYKLFFGESK